MCLDHPATPGYPWNQDNEHSKSTQSTIVFKAPRLMIPSEQSKAKEAKLKIDRLIDLCGPSPRGTGVQNLRECIIQTKWKYDVAAEDRQLAWRQMILNFMERYFYLICFATYAREFDKWLNFLILLLESMIINR